MRTPFERSADRITLSIASEDKAALGKIADGKKVSIAWVICDAITKYLSEELGYPPDLPKEAVKTVHAQAELLCADWI